MSEEIEQSDSLQQNEAFTIDDDSKAEWAIRKIKEIKADYERLISVCDLEIQSYQARKSSYINKMESETSFFRAMLRIYFQTVKTKDTKTQRKYELPSGNLILKFKSPKIIRDDEALVGWLSKWMPKAVKTTFAPDWETVKSVAFRIGDHYELPDENGEMIKIDGVTLVDQPDEFEVK